MHMYSNVGMYVAIMKVNSTLVGELTVMNKLELHKLAILYLVMLALFSTLLPIRYQQDISYKQNYVMKEPFSSGPLVTYSSLEATSGDT